jgi:biotin carboxyl carrier protein
MQFRIEVGEKTRNVVVQREGERFTITIDGRAHIVDARRLDAETLSLLVGNAAQGNTPADAAQGDTAAVRSVEAAIAPGREAGAFLISVNGQAVPVQMRIGGAGRRGRDAGGAAGAGPQKVVAPMPGKVVRVLVKPGDEVKAKQGLVVVEAMKMENELKAARAGRVRDVLVTEGRSVDAGAVLVIVE